MSIDNPHRESGSNSLKTNSAKNKRRFWHKLFPFIFKEAQGNLRENLIDALAQEDMSKKAFSPEEETMLTNIFALGKARVEDIMIPRSEIEAISIDASLADALKLFEEAGYSRMPVYSGSLDDPKGMIHMRDVLNLLSQKALQCKAWQNTKPDKANKAHCGEKTNQMGKIPAIDLTSKIAELNIIRNVLFVPHSMPAHKLLRRMQNSHIQMALVIDEHGGTDGLVALEDIVELIVGDIEDEHDDEDGPLIYREKENSWIVDARADLTDVAKALGDGFDISQFSEEVDTIGGAVLSIIEGIPLRGETINLNENCYIRILEADKRRIKKMRIRYSPNRDEAASE